MITSASLCLSKTLNCSNKCQCDKIKSEKNVKMPVRDSEEAGMQGMFYPFSMPVLLST